MPNIVLKDRSGNDITYDDVQQIVVKDTNGNYVYYSLGGGGGGVGTVTVLTLEHYTDDHQTALETILAPEVGDMAIIRAPITNDSETDELYEFTAYVFTEIAGAANYWQAMDGNYSMDNVFLGSDLVTTTNVGCIESGETIAKGTSIKELVSHMLQNIINPTVIQPSFSYTYNISATSQTSNKDVLGAVVTPHLTITFDDGNYEFGPDPTGSEFTAGSIAGTSRTITEGSMSATLPTITLDSAARSYSTAYGYTYTDGDIPLNNIGEEYPAGKIIGQTATAATSANLVDGTLDVTRPTITITPGTISNTLELGAIVNPSYTITINNPTGLYPYGHTVGTKGSSESAALNITTRSKTIDGTTSSFSGNTHTANWPNISLGATTATKSMSATCNWGNSPNTPVSQYGNAVPSALISAGSATNSATLSIPAGNRFIFWGYATVKTGITSSTIRSLTGGGSKKNAALTNQNMAEDTTKASIIIAAPKNTRTLTSVVMPSSSMADVTSQFVKQSNTISVEGANGYTAADYDVWVYAPAAMGGTYRITMS